MIEFLQAGEQKGALKNSAVLELGKQKHKGQTHQKTAPKSKDTTQRKVDQEQDTDRESKSTNKSAMSIKKF